MARRTGAVRLSAAILVSVLTVLFAVGCGSSSSSSGSASAQKLLERTFSGKHTVKSGILSFSLALAPQGSNTVKGPLELSLSGPFQSRGAGKLPESDLTISIEGLGHRGQLGIISTGANGYVTLDGVAYRLPASDFQKLESSFSGAGSGGNGLGKLGIEPLHWLTNPSIVGNETVAGTETTHIKAGIAVAALLGDLNTFLSKASSTTSSTSIPSSISAATRQKIASEVSKPTVDVWTGTNDDTLRKLTLSLGFPVTGQVSTLLGGISSAGFGLTLQYADLNQPQTIAAPTNAQPFTQFESKLHGVLSQVEGGLGASSLGSLGSAGSGSSGSSGSAASASSGSAAGLSKYTKCIERAANDVAKMQKCAPLLSGGGG